MRHNHAHMHGHEHPLDAEHGAPEPTMTADQIVLAIDHGQFDNDVELLLSALHNRKRTSQYRSRRRKSA